MRSTGPCLILNARKISSETSLPFGVIILAGGMGTRLGFSGPKGCMPVAGKTLFAHLLDRIVDVPVAIMTSPSTDAETRSHLSRYSGVDFFIQSEHPVVGSDGRQVCNKEGLPISVPTGNGAFFTSFVQSGLAAKWENQGIQTVNLLFVDNPSGQPMDTRGIHLIEHRSVELVLKGVDVAEVRSQVGLLVAEKGAFRVHEYDEKYQNHLGIAHTGMFSCRLSFIQRVAKVVLPWHVVYKQNFFQLEQFACDAYPFARGSLLIKEKADAVFTPIKEKVDVSLAEKCLLAMSR